MTADAAYTPDAEVEISVHLVRSLLTNQHPDLVHLPVKIMEAGWDNVMVRLGSELALRLPRRAIADELILNEQKWLPYLGPQLPVSIPVPIRTGKPQADYPFHWSVLPWLPGQAADLAIPIPSEANVLGQFLKTLHQVKLPENHPKNPVRDCPLSGKQADVERRMVLLQAETDLITPAILEVWKKALATEVDTATCWIAGDIHARNVLVENGKISAFIDWGDMCAGDRATDLSAIWALLSTPEARLEAQNIYEITEPTLARAKGWAVFFGVFLTETGLKDTPRHAKMGQMVLERLNTDGI